MATIKSRLDRASKQWAELQSALDARSVSILLDAGASADVDPELWPQTVHDGLALWGWTAQRAHDLLVRWRDTLDANTVISIQWEPYGTWNGQGDELLPDDQVTATPDETAEMLPNAPDAPKPEVTTDAPTWQQRKERFERETHQHERQRRLFPHELAERRRQRRPNWKVL